MPPLSPPTYAPWFHRLHSENIHRVVIYMRLRDDRPCAREQWKPVYRHRRSGWKRSKPLPLAMEPVAGVRIHRVPPANKRRDYRPRAAPRSLPADRDRSFSRRRQCGHSDRFDNSKPREETPALRRAMRDTQAYSSRERALALTNIEKVTVEIMNPVRRRIELLTSVIGVRPDWNIKERGVGEPFRIKRPLVDRALESLAVKSADIRPEVIDPRH